VTLLSIVEKFGGVAGVITSLIFLLHLTKNYVSKKDYDKQLELL